MTAPIAVDTGALRTLAKELERLTGETVVSPLGLGVAGPPSTRLSTPLDYLALYFHVSPDAAGWNILFADIVTYVEGRGADFASYVRDIATALTQSGAALRATADEYEAVNEDQRAALDGIAGAAFGSSTPSKSLPSDGYQPVCMREPMARMGLAPRWRAEDAHLVEKILTTSWTSPCALVNQVISEIWGLNPLRQVAACFAGNWSDVGTASEAAFALAWYLGAVADNVDHSFRACRELWQGDASADAEAYARDLASAARRAAEDAETVAKKLKAIAEGMSSAASLVAAQFARAMDCIVTAIAIAGLGGATASTVVGPALATLVDALLGVRALQAMKTALELTQTAVDTLGFAVAELKGVVAPSGGTSLSIPLPGQRG